MRIPLFSTFLLTTSAVFAANLTVSPDHPDGCYATGEPVTWTVVGGTTNLPYTVQEAGLSNIATGNLNFDGGRATVTAKLDHPGTLLLTVTVDEKNKAHGGAAFAWQQIQPSAQAPTDFDEFWKEKLKELANVPVNSALQEVDSDSPDVQLWKITMDNIRGTKINGYLARKRGDFPLPAVLQVQHAGTHALKKEWAVGLARNGFLALNIIAHDLPVDRDDSFYTDQLDKGPLHDYLHQGGDDREKSYFLRMYLACYRAVDYLTGRRDWNKHTLLVEGESMGGMQGVITAGLHPAVTAATLCVPAGADQTGVLKGRAIGFPYWIRNTMTGPEREACLKSCGYYDTVNFAKRIHCPVLIGMGLCDTTCPSEGVFAMFNQITAPKHLVILPEGDHRTGHAAYESIKSQWWKAAATDSPMPMN